MKNTLQASDELAPPEYWDGVYEDMPLEYSTVSTVDLLRPLLDQYVPRGGRCFEVGCYPGEFLVYLGKRYGMCVNGIDTTRFAEERLPQFLRQCGVHTGEIVCGNFFRWETTETYDFVCSFGFIEHFPNYLEVLDRHMALVKPGGVLMVTCPHFRGMQFLLHWLLDRPNLRRHYLPAMNVRHWRQRLEANGMEVLYDGYYRTAQYWADKSDYRLVNFINRGLRSVFRRIDARVQWPNPLLSPVLVSISRKA